MEDENNFRRSDERLHSCAIPEDAKRALYRASGIEYSQEGGPKLRALNRVAAVRLMLDELGLYDGRTLAERSAGRLWPRLERARRNAGLPPVESLKTRLAVGRLYISDFRKRRLDPVVLDGDTLCEEAGYAAEDVRDPKGRHPFRGTVAVALTAQGHDQFAVAKYLGVQQPAVSKLLQRAA